MDSREKTSFFRKYGERLAKFGIQAGVVAVLGTVAYLGAKHALHVAAAPSPGTTAETLAEFDDRLIGIAKGMGQCAVATLGNVAFLARLSSVGRRTTERQAHGQPVDWSLDQILDAPVQAEAEMDSRPALVEQTRNSLTDTLVDMQPIYA
ncbi:MAG TPA: hypothetical protein VFM05_05655 [Candidatus Saccharimonadales bacterium]|nr:hypothetical protein [Candidatus Saccharimonadales bacterium]